MKDGSLSLFIFLLLFWGALIGISNFFGENILIGELGSLSEEEETDLTFIERLFDTLDDIPLLGALTPLLKIMTFQYVNTVPYYVTIILQIISVLTIVVGISLVRN